METQKPTLHFVCGKIASGKTTLALRLSQECPAVLICEDEWLSKLYGFGEDLKTFEDYVKYSNRLKNLLASHIQNLLVQRLSVVLDFSGNTPKHREWVRSVFQGASADHLLHVLQVPDAECKRRLSLRNIHKPEGLYWGASATEEDYDLFTKYFSVPAREEGFNIRVHASVGEK